MRNLFVPGSAIAVLFVAVCGAFWSTAYLLYLLVLPAVVLGIIDMVQTEHSLRRNDPLVSRGRWFMEWLRPFIRQYFFESETDGAPVTRMFRSVVYQCSKGQSDTVPFGTKMDAYRDGYEWMAHSLAAIDTHGTVSDSRVTVGGALCRQPYEASLLNISAMSFGSLSSNAVLALDAGAHKGRFAHNTGEGGLSKYHLEHGGDLIWQIGTGYFGCRTQDGTFDEKAFRNIATLPSVKMIEIKLSQGAKPGHGGILPAAPFPHRFGQQMAESDPGSFMPRKYVALHDDRIEELDVAASA